MSGQQQIVAAGGAGLIALAVWTGDGRKKISDGLFHSHASDAQIAAAHGELKKLAGSVLLVGIATLAAGVSRQWGTAMVAVIGGLLLLYAINRLGGGAGTLGNLTPGPAGSTSRRPATPQ